jgi:hypothetical protein
MTDDEELESAFVRYAMAAGEGEDFDWFVRVVTAEVRSRGYLRCERCGGTMREHVIAALRASPGRLKHTFTNVGR